MPRRTTRDAARFHHHARSHTMRTHRASQPHTGSHGAEPYGMHSAANRHGRLHQHRPARMARGSAARTVPRKHQRDYSDQYTGLWSGDDSTILSRSAPHSSTAAAPSAAHGRRQYSLTSGGTLGDGDAHTDVAILTTAGSISVVASTDHGVQCDGGSMPRATSWASLISSLCFCFFVCHSVSQAWRLT